MTIEIGTKPDSLHFDSPDVPSISELQIPKDCTSIRISWGSNLTDLKGIEQCRNLAELELGFCSSLTDLSPLLDLPELRRLSVEGCKGIVDWSPLGKLTGLTALNISHISSDAMLPAIANLKDLTDLDLSGIPLRSLALLTPLKKLKRLKLESCFSLFDISSVSAFPDIESIDIGFCYDLLDVSPLGHIPPTNIATVPEYFYDEGWTDHFTIWYETWASIQDLYWPVEPNDLTQAQKELDVIFPVRVFSNDAPLLFATHNIAYLFGTRRKVLKSVEIAGNASEHVAALLKKRIEQYRTPPKIKIQVASSIFFDILRLLDTAIATVTEIEVTLWPHDLTGLSNALATTSIARLAVSNLGNVSEISGLFGVTIDTLSVQNCPVISDITGNNCSISRVEIINCPLLTDTPSIAEESYLEPEIIREEHL